MDDALSTTTLVAVVGSGAMGSGIAQVAAAAGHFVRLFDSRAEAADQAVLAIRQTFGMLAQKGRMTTDAALAAGARVQSVATLAQLADAGLIIEAIVEDLDAKRRLFADLEQVVGPGCIFATNTSSISVTAMAKGLRFPARLAGMHFFNPVPLMALVEVVRGLATDRAVADVVHATAAAWGKIPVHATSTPGFIVNRVARPYYAEALRLLTEQAADLSTIDAVMREAGGFRMGPFALMDMIGHDVNFAVTQSVFNAYFNDPRFTPSLVQQELVNAGFLGRKAGRGFYRYGEEFTVPEPQTETAQALPGAAVLFGATSFAEVLAGRLSSCAIELTHAQTQPDNALLECCAASVYLCDGRSATERARANDKPNTILLDLALDYDKATRLALVAADQCSAEAYQAVVGLFQAGGYKVSRLDDVPGMAVMRTVVMLANEAADAVNQGVCSAAEVDTALKKGVNYPCGPLEWADAISPAYVVTVLDNLAATYGEDRYRVSPLLRRKVAARAKFYG